MGEAKRRRMAAADRRSGLDTDVDLQKLHEEAGGVLRHALIGDIGALAAAAANGDARSRQYLRAIEEFWRRAGERYDTVDAVLCIICGRELTEATCGLVDVVTAERVDRTVAMLLGVCTGCCAVHRHDPVAIGSAIFAVLRQAVWPDLRPIAAPSGRVGRA